MKWKMEKCQTKCKSKPVGNYDTKLKDEMYGRRKWFEKKDWAREQSESLLCVVHCRWMTLTSKSPMVNRVAASESVGGKSGLITYILIYCKRASKHKNSKKMNILLETNLLISIFVRVNVSKWVGFSMSVSW